MIRFTSLDKQSEDELAAALASLTADRKHSTFLAYARYQIRQIMESSKELEEELRGIYTDPKAADITARRLHLVLRLAAWLAYDIEKRHSRY